MARVRVRDRVRISLRLTLILNNDYNTLLISRLYCNIYTYNGVNYSQTKRAKIPRPMDGHTCAVKRLKRKTSKAIQLHFSHRASTIEPLWHTFNLVPKPTSIGDLNSLV